MRLAFILISVLCSILLLGVLLDLTAPISAPIQLINLDDQTDVIFARSSIIEQTSQRIQLDVLHRPSGLSSSSSPSNPDPSIDHIPSTGSPDSNLQSRILQEKEIVPARLPKITILDAQSTTPRGIISEQRSQTVQTLVLSPISSVIPRIEPHMSQSSAHSRTLLQKPSTFPAFPCPSRKQSLPMHFTYIPTPSNSAVIHSILSKDSFPSHSRTYNAATKIQWARWNTFPATIQSQYQVLAGPISHSDLINSWDMQQSLGMMLVHNSLDAALDFYQLIISTGSTHPFYSMITRNGLSLEILQQYFPLRFIDLLLPPGTQSADPLTEAKSIIQDHYPILGTTENIDTFTQLLQCHMPWLDVTRLSSALSPHVTSREQRKAVQGLAPEPEQQVIDILHEYYALDVELWRYALQLSESKLSGCLSCS